MQEPEYERGKILIVDDTVSVINMIKTALSNESYQILIATSGENAIKSAKIAQPDLILLDILMPEMDGYEACRRLKSDEETKDIPVLFMSALTEVFDKVKAFNLGAVDYVTKPLNVEELQARVHTQVKLSKMQRKLKDTNKWLEEKVEERTRELKKSHQRYKTVADYTYDWEYWLSSEEQLEYISPSCEKVTGYEMHEFIDSPGLINEIIYDEDSIIWEQHRVEEYQYDSKELVFRIKTKQGEIRWIGHVCRQVYDENDQLAGIRASNRDITSRINAENEIKRKSKELKERNEELLTAEEEIRATNEELQDSIDRLYKSEERYRNFIHLSSEGIHRWEFTEPMPLDISFEEQAKWLTEKHHLAECNKAFAKMYGFEKPDEILGKRLADLEESEETALEINGQFVKNNYNWINFETEEVTKSGKLKYFLNNLIGIIEDNKLIRLWGTQADITKRKLAEIEILESQRKLESIFRAAPTGIGVVVNRILTEVNPQVCKIIGYEQQELIGENAIILYPTKEEYEWVGKEKYKQIAKKGTGTVETKWKRKDGKIIDVLLSSTAVDETDLQKGVTFTVLDITKSKSLQNALKESQERFDLAMTATHDGIFDWNLGTNEIYYSPGWKKMLGYEEHELENDFSVWEKLTDLEDIKKSWQVLNDHIEGRLDRFELGFKMRHKNGHWVDILSRANAFFNEDGKAVRVVGTHVDISEQKKTEKALREEKEFTDIVLDSLLDTFFLFEPDSGRALRWNRSFRDISGYTDAEIACLEAPASYYSQKDLEKAGKFIERILQNGYGTIELEFICKNGKKIPTEYSVALIQHEDGEKYLISIGRDISERKEAEGIIRRSQSNLSAVIESSSETILSINKNYEILTINNTGVFEFQKYLNSSLTPGLNILEEIPEHFRKEWKERYDRAFKGEIVKLEDYLLERGQRFYTDVTISPIIEDKEITGAVVFSKDITTKKLDDNIQSALLRLIDFAANNTLNELLQKFLDEAEVLTDSSIGFYHFLEDDQETITLQAWSTNTLENMCTAEGKGLHYPVSEAGVWVDCIRRQEPVIHNDYANLIHKKGMPEGHAEVIRELVVPVFRGEKMVAILGVGNKEYDYNQQDVETIQKLADLAWETVVRKQAEEFMLEEKNRVTNILQATNAGTWDWNLQTGEVRNDERWCNIIGYALKELQPLKTYFWQQNMHPDDLEQATNALNKHLSGELEYYEAEFRQKHKNGNWVWIMSRGKVIEWTVEGKPLRMYGTHLNINKRKLAEQELKQRNTFIQTVLDRLPIGVALNKFDKGEATYMNKKFEEIYGWSFEELKNVPTFFKRVYPDEKYRKEIVKRIMDDINSGIIDRMQWEDIEITQKNGDKRIINAVNIPLFEQNTMVSTVIDVTRQKEYEKELEKHRNNLELLVKDRTDELEASNEELEAANEKLNAQKNKLEKTIQELNKTQAKLIQSEKMASLGVLVAGVAHEINNPVNFINSSLAGLKSNLEYLLGFSDLYSELKNNTQATLEKIKEKEKEASLNEVLGMFKRSVEIIEVGIERTTKIVKGLKAFARSDEKRLEKYDIHKSIDNTLLILYNQFKDRVQITKEFGDLPEIECFPSQINQVVMNILTNAIHAIDYKGEITIKTGMTDNSQLSIEIKDTGKGIPEEQLKHIFDPFFTTKEVGKGTGLGLSIAYGIINDHNGEINVESELGKGTIFKITLPVKQ
jgi:PAS domain S-box-containing protein